MNNLYNILFVDDTESNIFHINSIIELDHLPISPSFKQNPAEALEYLRQLKKEDFPDCIISDIHMPLLDGFEFADQYMIEFHLQNPETLFFIASSSYQPSDIEKVERHPCIEAFLEKPMDKQIFEKHLFPVLDMVLAP